MIKILYWIPRVVGILAILFISSFALDVFQEGTPSTQMLLGLAVHLIPSAVLAALLAVAWRYEIVGGLFFVAISFVPFFLLSNQVWVNAILCAPLLLTGILFFASSYCAARNTKVSGEQKF
jgi:hypothetical protein